MEDIRRGGGLLIAFHVAMNAPLVVDAGTRRTGFPESVEQVRDEVTRMCLGYLCGDQR
ncbi:hypothetical protein KO481_38815 [Nocardia sp. NEAU-G5]|uniref:Uncharacterized protein n=1 Tax=Nocardia albiluteola TaxID=2842303 RepID=A0ABS6BBD8_9NOCA|nr:hypothetical protein [Nocardia albiluteola]MBU3067463.1 hypothetical protein [Nocardia albiluteola]